MILYQPTNCFFRTCRLSWCCTGRLFQSAASRSGTGSRTTQTVLQGSCWWTTGCQSWSSGPRRAGFSLSAAARCSWTWTLLPPYSSTAPLPPRCRGWPRSRLCLRTSCDPKGMSWRPPLRGRPISAAPWGESRVLRELPRSLRRRRTALTYFRRDAGGDHPCRRWAIPYF